MNPKARDAIVATIPVGRIGTPEDIWRGVKFAIECDYLNGTTIDIDGGAKL
jgi:3-oxoacyl-[acyl-carrier protein] reductase